MSINKNRKFRFTFDNLVRNSYELAIDNESESRDKTITKDLSKMTVYEPQKKRGKSETESTGSEEI